MTATEHLTFFEELSRIFHRHHHHVSLAVLDINEDRDHDELGYKYVPDEEYPQFIWFRNGEATQYHRTIRSHSEVLLFVEALDRNPLISISRAEEAADYNPCVVCA